MKTLKVTDGDGAPFYYVADTDDLLRREQVRHEAKARRHGCLLREVPTLGAPAGQNWHRDFKVTERDGIIVGIEVLR